MQPLTAGAITFVGSPGTGAPPAKLGPYTMTPFGPDPQPLDAEVPGVMLPKTGPSAAQVSFTPALLHLRVASWNSYQGQGASWTNGYTGDVYATATLSQLQNVQVGAVTSMTFTMPAKTVGAFYFYAVPGTCPSRPHRARAWK